MHTASDKNQREIPFDPTTFLNQGILDALTEQAVFLDTQNRVLWANQASCNSVNTSLENLRGRHCYEIWHDSQEPCTGCPVLESLMTGQPCENTLISPDGRCCFIRAIPLRDESGEMVGALELLSNLTEFKAAEMALSRRNEFIETVLDQLPVGVVVNRASTGESLLINSAYVQMTGWQKEVLSNPAKCFPCLFPDSDYRWRMISLLQEGVKGGIAERMRFEDVMVTTSSGEHRYLTIQGFPIFGQDLVVFTAVDMTKRFHDRVTLKRSEDRFRVISEMVSDHAYGLRVRPEGITAWKWGTGNRNTIFGAPLEKWDFLGQWRKFVHPDDADILDKHLEKLLAGERDTAEFRIIRPSGEVRWMINQSHQWGDREYGPGNYIIGALHDVTEARLAEQERRNMEARVQQSQKMESLGILAGGIAHDFNNLLMAILGNADLALADLSTASPARPYLESIESASRRAASLCQQMLAYSGKGRYVVESLDLNEVISEMAHMLELSVPNNALLRFKFSESLPLIEADSTQIRQIVMNLVTNSSEAMGDQSGIIVISTTAVECSSDDLARFSLDETLPPGLYVALEVQDTGCGMDEATRSRMFDPFFTTKFTGRGLGMAAVMGIVRGHKGAIEVKSEVGRGTTIRVLFPARKGSESEELSPFASRPQSWKGIGTLLIAEDEEYVRTLTKTMLERLGFQIIAASNGLETLDLYRTHRKEIDCVLLDLTMPGMDGQETFRELRKIDSSIPVVITSGYDKQRVTEQFADEEPTGFIQKPYTLLSLSETLQRVLEQPHE